jgi:hypothetical protein
MRHLILAFLMVVLGLLPGGQSQSGSSRGAYAPVESPLLDKLRSSKAAPPNGILRVQHLGNPECLRACDCELQHDLACCQSCLQRDPNYASSMNACYTAAYRRKGDCEARCRRSESYFGEPNACRIRLCSGYCF